MHLFLSSSISQYCESASPGCGLDTFWTHFAKVIRVSGRSVSGVSQISAHTIPGWILRGKDLFVQARMNFLTWQGAESLRDGDLAISMKLTRVSFGSALKPFKDNKDKMGAEILAAKLKLKNTICFWAKARKTSSSKRSYLKV